MSVFDSMGTEVGALEWDATIEKESDFILLPEGEYEFEVISFERARYNGGDKLPPCNQAKLKLQITVPEGTATINHNLFLHSRCEGILSSFFICIGQKNHGEKLKMDWSKVLGAKGRAKVSTRVYNDNTFNEIKRFLEPEAATQPQPASTLFKPGSF